MKIRLITVSLVILGGTLLLPLIYLAQQQPQGNPKLTEV